MLTSILLMFNYGKSGWILESAFLGLFFICHTEWLERGEILTIFGMLLGQKKV